MQNILLTISYDGTDFCGWQRQLSDAGAGNSTASGKRPADRYRTVQGEIEKALERLFGERIALQGSGRTDSGVHAAGQAATFLCPVESIPPKNISLALNNFLPPDIRINSSVRAEDNFSARFSATSRVYRYFILPRKEIPAAASCRFVWQVKSSPDVEMLNKMAALLKGEIDFKTFTAAGDAALADEALSTKRYVESARFFEQTDLFGQRLLVFEIEANAFLYKMVRSLTGTLIDAAEKGKSPEDFKAALDSRDRSRAGPTAPPTGLFLWQVKFDGKRRH